jgi:hypothetical protein
MFRWCNPTGNPDWNSTNHEYLAFSSLIVHEIGSFWSRFSSFGDAILIHGGWSDPNGGIDWLLSCSYFFSCYLSVASVVASPPPSLKQNNADSVHVHISPCSVQNGKDAQEKHNGHSYLVKCTPIDSGVVDDAWCDSCCGCCGLQILCPYQRSRRCDSVLGPTFRLGCHDCRII